MEISNLRIQNKRIGKMKKFYTVKIVEKDGDDKILNGYEVGCWDILTNTFAESVFEMTKRFVESKNSDPDICEDIVERLLKI
jgi:hypothetical protein